MPNACEVPEFQICTVLTPNSSFNTSYQLGTYPMSLRQLHDTLMEFCGLPLNSCTSRCLFGPFNVGLGLFKDCNAKNLKQGKMPLHR